MAASFTFQDTLHRNYGSGSDSSKKVSNLFHGEFVSPVILKEPVSRDADDDKFIATALAAKCKLIVSGDKDLLTVDGCFSIELIKPNEFVNKYLA